MEDEATKRHVLVIGAGLGGLAAVRELRRGFQVTVVDAKEYFEFTPGILRAYVQPSHWETLIFPYQEVLERRLKVTFLWGEVSAIDADEHYATVKTTSGEEGLSLWQFVEYHFCLIASGCNFNQFSPTGESPWFPVIHEVSRMANYLDERYLEGRRQRIMRENQELNELNTREASVLVVGGGYQGVQWACELKFFFPALRVVLTDFMPRCLGPLPEDAAAYCEEYMKRVGITTQYNVKYDEKSAAFWDRIKLPSRADKTYLLSGAKHSNYFVGEEVWSNRGPGGGGWILVNKYLQVVTKSGDRWGEGVVFAVGDCVFGGVGEAPKWEIPPVPKTGFPAEQQAIHACRNIKALDRKWFARRCLCVPWQHTCGPRSLRPSWFPWAASVFAISLGPQDGVVICGASEKGAGRIFCRGKLASALKEVIEATKVASSRHEFGLSRILWHYIHHCRGPLCC
ncbi:unnamed protein product [Effrenium voratum]|uniref:FAD/NAD(P)-binding domain-containing protein n=1 Tax=Effrenium voratum TaxID=2562239 RepID=A0AA36J336_9DINO|nr:unnamed protein product [Effrenium voratum]